MSVAGQKLARPWQKWQSLELWQQIFVALVAGIVLGIVLNQTGNEGVANGFKPLGDIFLNAIRMLIVPLIFVSLVCGMVSMDDMGKMGRISLKTVALYLCTTAVAITIGLVLGSLIQPGVGVDLSNASAPDTQAPPPYTESFTNIIPTNPITSAAEGNVLQIIVFALLFGLSINLAGEKATQVRDFFNSLSEVIYKLTAIIIATAPYGVFALMVWVAGTFGLSVLLSLATVVLAVYLGCLLHAAIVYGGLLAFVARLNPIRFVKGALEPILVSYTISSSSGTLPVSLFASQNNLGVSRRVASFVLPLGATINMDGTALYIGVCSLFVAQAFGVDLATGDYLTIVLTATLASIGTAGVPGAGLIMLSLALTSVGLPLEGVGIIAGIDRILDMARTSLNVTGDNTIAVVVAQSEDEIDLSVYNSTDNAQIDSAESAAT